MIPGNLNEPVGGINQILFFNMLLKISQDDYIENYHVEIMMHITVGLLLVIRRITDVYQFKVDLVIR